MKLKPMKDHRRILLRLIKEHSIGTMVEVGVASGRTSELLLKENPQLRMVLVDKWGGPRMQAITDSGAICLDKGLVATRERVEFAKDRVEIVHCASDTAIHKWHGLADLVFIDAGHHYEAVIEDCRAWWQRLRSGGLFTGHDIDGRKDLAGIYGVRKAVEEFSKEVAHEFTVERSVWMMVKR